MPLSVACVLRALNMHWYKAKYLTRGLMVAYMQRCFQQQYFSASNDPKQNLAKNLKQMKTLHETDEITHF